MVPGRSWWQAPFSEPPRLPIPTKTPLPFGAPSRADLHRKKNPPGLFRPKAPPRLLCIIASQHPISTDLTELPVSSAAYEPSFIAYYHVQFWLRRASASLISAESAEYSPHRSKLPRHRVAHRHHSYQTG